MKKVNILIALFFTLSSITFAQIPPYLPANGLVAWLPFNGNGNDESGLNHQVTAIGPNLTTDRFGISDRAYSFNGTSDKISIVDNAVPDFDFIEFSVSVWALKDNQTIFFPGIISRCQANNIGWYLYANSGVADSIDFSGAITTGNYFNAYGPTVISNQWTNYIFTFSPGSQKMYVNGTLVGSDNNPGSVFNIVGDILIGYKTGGSYWGGKIDDVAIYNRELSQSEITSIYNACSLSISSDPVDQTVSAGNSTQFIVSTPDSLASYQWQVDAGAGFMNLSNAGAYNGVFTSVLTVSNITAAMNDYKFQCVLTDTSGCTVTSTFAILTVCNSAINQQPQDQTVFTNDNAMFTIGFTASSPIYQWQENAGFGFMNIINGGMYSGANTNTLTISNVSLGMNNYLYRCLVSDSTACSDSSNTVSLTVLNTNGINENIQSSSYIIYPNPAIKSFTIFSSKQIQNMQIELINILGETKHKSLLNQEKQLINIQELEPGVYFLKIYNNEANEVKKVVIK